MSAEAPDPVGLREAIGDYLFLLERGYSQSSALKLVGDRYQLSSVHRSMLYRGIVSRAAAARRRARMAASPRGERLAVDTYNVLFTVVNYLCGRPLFLANDGYLRDAGELHSPEEKPPALDRALDLVMEQLGAEAPESLLFAIDEPVSHSGRLAAGLRRRLSALALPGDAETVRSPDWLLKNQRSGMVATSDSAVIDQASVPIYDLARHTLERAFAPSFPDLSRLAAR